MPRPGQHVRTTYIVVSTHASRRAALRSGRGTEIYDLEGRDCEHGRITVLDWQLVEVLSSLTDIDVAGLAEAVRETTLALVDETVADSLVVEWASRRFARRKLEQYLQKALEPEVYLIAARIEAARSHAQAHAAAGSAGDMIVVSEGGIGGLAVRRYAARYGIECVIVGSGGLRLVSRALAAVWRRVLGTRRVKADDPSKDEDMQGVERTVRLSDRPGEPVRPAIATWYSGRGLGLDAGRRSDLFWLVGSRIPSERVLVYFSRTDLPMTETLASDLTAASVAAVALEPGLAARSGLSGWRPGSCAMRLRMRAIGHLLGGALLSLLRFRVPDGWVFAHLVDFVWTYGYWYEFLRKYGVKVSISSYDFSRHHIALNHALHDLGGVSLAYQYSHTVIPSISTSMVADILFCFGRHYVEIYRESRSTSRYLVMNGYPTDLAFRSAEHSASTLRATLEDRGAEFCITVFDEGSSDRRVSLMRNDDTRSLYSFFLDWASEDPSLGLVFKPKHPRSLRARLGPITERLDEAIATGRCIMLDSGPYATESYPCEAAFASDVVVGLLSGGTATLEAALAGVPTVLLNEHGIFSSQRVERETNVFTDICGLRRSLEAWRAEVDDQVTALGWERKYIAHSDGKAAQRIGEYIANLSDALAAGASSEDAIDSANRAHMAEWGEGTVVPLCVDDRPDGGHWHG